ncbi:PIN domain-containing protein [Streptacidiphilus sp. MAP5-3]|uniref:PIN domain-containing protein n=1 Tax=unclassified Streptacidiphilus TaxID=2643834 RepID=UPI00351985CA
MPGAGGFLIDASAVGRMMRPDVIERWREQIASGRIGICEVTTLEVLRGARSREEFASLRSGLESVYNRWPMPEKVFRQALEIQERLLDAGALRTVGTTELLLVATAAQHGLTLLHYDAELHALGNVIDLPTRWLAEPGTID